MEYTLLEQILQCLDNDKPIPKELRLSIEVVVNAHYAKYDTQRAYRRAMSSHVDTWVPANGGSEEPFFTRYGQKLLYCYNPKLGKHAYVDAKTDLVLSDDEALKAIGVY